VPKAILARAEVAAAPGLAEEARLRTEVDVLLHAVARGGQLQSLIDLVDDAVRRVEAVCLYVDDELFSVVERFTSLIDKEGQRGLLSELREKPLGEWTPAQRLGVAGLRALFLSGRSVRFEEFNGKQMTARRLFARLRELAQSYVKHGAKLDLTTQSGLFALATAVGQAAQQSVGQEWLRYRWINGLTFLKTERLACTPKSSEVDHAIPESIANLYACWVGKPFDRNLGYRKVFTALADVAISARMAGIVEKSAKTPAKTPLEVLIQEIVTAAVFATGADYGMSSSLRDLRPLLTADYRSRLQSMLALKPRDFYCCIVSRPGLREEVGQRISEDVYRAVQARMQYNRWHFVAGNFPETDVPRSRHYFYPPAMPDLAEWSDHHHGGHTRAGVRYSIRSPGPDMGQPPLSIAGYPYRGFYDVRVVRMEGPPFALRHMLVTRHHCLWMGVLWHRIVAYCERQPGAAVISGFEKGEGYEPEAKSSVASLSFGAYLPPAVNVEHSIRERIVCPRKD